MLIYVKSTLLSAHDGKIVLPLCNSKSPRRPFWGLLVALMFIAVPAEACTLETARHETIAAVYETGDIRLESGKMLRLAGVLWPDHGRTAHRTRLKYELEALVLGDPARVRLIGPPDRWSRTAALIEIGDTTTNGWKILQEHLLGEGLLAFWPERNRLDCEDNLRASEGVARSQQLGIWSPARRRAGRWRLQGDKSALISSRMIFEATVHSVRSGRRVTFVNFQGPRGKVPGWMLTQRDVSMFRSAGRDPLQWSGRRLLLRANITDSAARRLSIPAPAHVDGLDGPAQ